MKLKFKYAGKLQITEPTIDVTDPGYDADVWCRLLRDITPGPYNCYAGTGKDGCGLRVYVLILLSADIDFDDQQIEIKRDGEIGVDAGLAGFFQNKPDYETDDWNNICNFIFESGDATNRKQFWLVDESSPLKCKCFFCESGIGDGVYELSRLEKDGRLVGYKLNF